MILHGEKIESLIGARIQNSQRLSGGMIGDVYRLDFEDGHQMVAKVSPDPESTLDIEGKMLDYLNTHSPLPVPQVIHSDQHLLLMTYIPVSGGITRTVEEDAARHIAALHAVQNSHCGFEFDTLIGSLHQPNPFQERWVDFFREQRLLYMADIAYTAHRLSIELRKRIDSLAAVLDSFLSDPQQPSLLHGDLWGGNVLVANGKIAGFVDPAIYYGHPEIELAFTTLFGTFGKTFFEAYNDINPIEPGFFETRKDIYNLYPLLVHVRLFGGGYSEQVNAVLRQLGL